MSSKQNHNDMIHLGNYEEFFILYMDNELNEAQRKMVDDFLAAHPDLQAELEILMSAKLPAEELRIDKEELYSGHMKLNAVSEDLLLYIDNELPEDQAKRVALEIASNEDYKLQHEVLLRTRLNAKEKIVYPNKKELYRSSGRTLIFKPWMQVAAAVLVVATMGVLYFTNPGPEAASGDTRTTAIIPDNKNNTSNHSADHNKVARSQKTEPRYAKPAPEMKQEQLAANDQPARIRRVDVNNYNKEEVTEAPGENFTAYEPSSRLKAVPQDVPFKPSDEVFTAAVSPQTINNLAVTNPVIGSYHTTNTPDEGALANNDEKGSVKGLLRKATRLIEKRTGIDPVNEDGRLLIGAVAVRLK